MKTPAAVTAVVVAAAALLAGCEAPPIETSQQGFRGTGMVEVEDQDDLREKVRSISIPDVQPPTDDTVPAPEDTYENVRVLDHLSVAEFNRTMAQITEWVSPQQGCNYCHVADEGQVNLASEDIYTKRVSRQMIEMTREINAEWQEHVGEDGVSCYTCHRGQPVPSDYWYFSGPTQVERAYLDREDLRVQGSAALAVNDSVRTSLKQTEWTYAVMIDMSKDLGVNCVYCHNSPRWSDWEESTASRVTALRGFRMTRWLNQEHMVPLQDEWPEERLGPRGDGPKISCASCHQGAYRPLYGADTGVSTFRGLYPPFPPGSGGQGATASGGPHGVPSGGVADHAPTGSGE